jgi:uncharacterized protein (DUF697 family)
MVQALVPDPVADVFALVPVQLVYCDPTAAALPRKVVKLVRSVFTAASTAMVPPAVGAVLLVIATPV